MTTPPSLPSLSSSDIETRLTTVQRVLGWLAKEVADIVQLVHAPSGDAALKPEQLIFSPISAQGVDVQSIIAAADQHAASLALLSGAAESEASRAVKALYLGTDSLPARYLSPRIIHGGKGVLYAGPVLKQYETDAATAHVQRLVMWPAGFYRNDATKDTQLFLKSPDRHTLVCIDGLPSNVPTVKVFTYNHESQQFQEHVLPNAMELSAGQCEVFTNAASVCVQASLAMFSNEQLNLPQAA